MKANLNVHYTNENKFAKAIKLLIKEDQRKHFSDVISYFENPSRKLKDIPPIVSQLNIFRDGEGILKVKSKFRKWYASKDNEFPILLSKRSHLTEILIMDCHKNFNHSGCYTVLAELRKKFYIPHHFSTVKKVLKKCILCKRFNTRPIQLNQGLYREFRANPPSKPFANIFIDHLGPFKVKRNKETTKIWLLCVTCTWSRAVNLKICKDLSLKEFLRNFQMHCFEFGLPEQCISDSGSQFQAGANVILDFLNDPETQFYFEKNNIKNFKFDQYFKGHSELGSMVEICVKMVKRLIYGSITTNVLLYEDFEFLISYVIHIINKRPIAFKEALRDAADDIPEPITPEHLIRGYELNSFNIIPNLHEEEEQDKNFSLSSKIEDSYHQLRKVRIKLLNIYQNEFLKNLISQAVDRSGRYRPVTHHEVKIGDIILLKEPNQKPNHYPMGIVKKVFKNNLGEVTGALILKGKTREMVKRHSSTIIPLLEENSSDVNVVDNGSQGNAKIKIKKKRKAAEISEQKTRNILLNDTY